MNKTTFSYLLIVMVLLLLVSCSNKASDNNASTQSIDHTSTQSALEGEDIAIAYAATNEPSKIPDRVFTLEELKTYNGENNNPAYVAVNGIVYDVSHVLEWSNGLHQGLTAGNDLTEEFSNSPHGMSTLQSLPIVGTLE